MSPPANDKCHVFFRRIDFFFAGKEPVYYNKDTLISEICAAKGVLLEQDTIILAGYLPDFRKNAVILRKEVYFLCVILQIPYYCFYTVL